MGKALVKFALSWMIVTAAAAQAMGCSCSPPPPPCQAFFETPMVFLGTVIEVLEVRDNRPVRVRMRIDVSYKGVKEKTLTLFDDGMCNGPDLQLGEQYLMYTRRAANGDVPSRGCTRSRHVKYAQEDLEYLSSLRHAAPTAAIFGKVIEVVQGRDGDLPTIAGVRVEADGPAGRHATLTDAEGRYAFEGLEPGMYKVDVYKPGFASLVGRFGSFAPETEVDPRGCAQLDLYMRRVWAASVSGRVVRSNGMPAPAGLPVFLLRVNEGEDKKELGWAFAGDPQVTDEGGQYVFHGVAPGRYKIALNLYRYPTVKAPYPTLFWPAARSETQASIIEVGEAETGRRFDFILPPEPRSVIVTGRVFHPDGAPAGNAWVLIRALPDNQVTDDSANQLRTDEQGMFRFAALEGFEYELSASWSTGGVRCAKDARFSLTKGERTVELSLDCSGGSLGDPLK